MYLGVDVGATKTLLALFTKDGQIREKLKFATAQNYDKFKEDLKINIHSLGAEEVEAVAIGMPGLIDYQTGMSIDAGGNLSWKNTPVKEDVHQILPSAKVLIHNDAKLAGLSQAASHKKYKKILYLTISTGIGGAVITNGVIDPDFINFEPGRMIIEHGGKDLKWEQFASGKALAEQYGKLASEIEDPKIWRSYAEDLAIGFQDCLANIQPDLVIVGGGAGAHLEKFEDYLKQAINKFSDPLVPIPPIVKAKNPEEAVIYGCYEYIKQQNF